MKSLASQVAECLDTHGSMTSDELLTHVPIGIDRLHSVLGALRRGGYVQTVRVKHEPNRYAPTSKQYTGHRQVYRQPCALYAADGCAWIFPSLQALATVLGKQQASVWQAVNNNWRIRGERVSTI